MKLYDNKLTMVFVILILFIGMGLSGCTLSEQDGHETNQKTSPQEKVLNQYFKALNHMDLDAVYSLSAPKESKRAEGGFSDATSLADMMLNQFSYGASSMQHLNLENHPELAELYLQSYGFASVSDGGLEDFQGALKNDDLFQEHFKDFKVDYELISMKQASEYKFTYYRSLNSREIDDMKEYISTGLEVPVEEVYAAKIKIHWSYGDKKYGFDKSWWNSSAFQEYIASGAVRDDNLQELTTYKKIVEYYDNKIYNAILFESDGEWYLFDPYIMPHKWPPYDETSAYSRWKVE